MSVLDNTRCMVFNADGQPIQTVNARRGLVLYLKGKAEVTGEAAESYISSEGDVWPVPTQIMLKKYRRVKSMFDVKAHLTQRNLFTRDNHTCQYCGRYKSELRSSEFLTRDHVHPTHKGGTNTWENVVTCCSTCNNKKSNFTLSELNWKLLSTPRIPTRGELWKKSKKQSSN